MDPWILFKASKISFFGWKVKHDFAPLCHIYNFYALMSGPVQMGIMRILNTPENTVCTHAALFQTKTFPLTVGNDKKPFDFAS